MPGVDISVAWTLEIAHPADVLDTGVRIAIHYSEDDSFASNVLRGTLDGAGEVLKGTHAAAVATAANMGETLDFGALRLIIKISREINRTASRGGGARG